MEEKKVRQKRNVVALDASGMKMVLELRHQKELKVGRTVSLKEAIMDALKEKYARDVKEKEVSDKIY
jgi:hypothetical protein